MKKASNYLTIIFLTIFQITAMGQSSNQNNIIPIDYSNNNNWSITDTVTHEIDVFFVHPTTYRPPSNGKYIADINNQKLNKETDLYAIQQMTAAFSENCNIFAPRYRQVNIEVLSMTDDKLEEYSKTPIADIKEALSYYLENINNGRPFILASHSQGSFVLQSILIENPDIINLKKLVAAYMPGWTFPDEIIEKIKIPLGTTPDQTGCLIVWNTIGTEGSSPVLNEGARCVNPLSWTTDLQEYPDTMHKGARILFNDHNNVEVDNFTSAKINNYGGLEIPIPDQDIIDNINMSMGPDCFHSYDYDFFFHNIMENVSLRCRTYLDKNQVN